MFRSPTCAVAGTQASHRAVTHACIRYFAAVFRFAVSLERKRLSACDRADMSQPCATMGCRNTASAACSAAGGPYCGSCCRCTGHSRRSERGGSHRGHWSAAKMATSSARFAASRELADAADYLLHGERALCAAYRLSERTSVMRFVMVVTLARLSWDSLPPRSRQGTAWLYTALADALEATRMARLLDCMRVTVQQADIVHVGQQAAELWSRIAPSTLLSTTAASQAARASRSRSPPATRSITSEVYATQVSADVSKGLGATMSVLASITPK